MTFFARLIRKIDSQALGAPRYRDDFVPCSFDPSGAILRAEKRGRHSLAFYFWALSQSI